MEAGLFGVMEILCIVIEVMMVTGVYKFVRLNQNISKSIVNKVSFYKMCEKATKLLIMLRK